MNGTVALRMKHETEFRRRTASTKVTEEEFRELEAFAQRRGQSMSEWVRQTLLAEARNQNNTMMTAHIFTDLVGVQMLLMSALEPLLCGEKLAREEVAQRFRHIQKVKVTQAQELLAKRSKVEEK
jgi:hypothetical protein